MGVDNRLFMCRWLGLRPKPFPFGKMSITTCFNYTSFLRRFILFLSLLVTGHGFKLIQQTIPVASENADLRLTTPASNKFIIYVSTYSD